MASLYVYDEQGHLIGEYDNAGRTLHETVYLGNEPVAVLTQTYTGAAPNQVWTTTAYYVYPDQIATPRVITQGIRPANPS